MIKLSDLGQVYIVCGKTDLRKGIDGLATLVKEQFELDPFSGKVFLSITVTGTVFKYTILFDAYKNTG